jgi:hypothetical protein
VTVRRCRERAGDRPMEGRGLRVTVTVTVAELVDEVGGEGGGIGIEYGGDVTFYRMRLRWDGTGEGFEPLGSY